MEVKILKLGGDSYHVQYNINSLTEFFEDMGVNIFGGETFTMSLKAIRSLVFRGIEEGCRRQGQPFILSKYDVGDLIESHFGDTTGFIELFTMAMPEIVEKMTASSKPKASHKAKS